MPSLVTSGATLRCSKGVGTSTLHIAGGRGVNAGGNPVATVADHQAMVNILPVSLCQSPGNPQQASGSAPCTPVTPAPWTPGSPSVMAGGLPVVNSSCQCQCQYGGTILVVSPGQPGVTAG
jgi:hypothetical protein